VTNGLLVVNALAGQVIVLRNRRRSATALAQRAGSVRGSGP
jgi:hypothetical protein